MVEFVKTAEEITAEQVAVMQRMLADLRSVPDLADRYRDVDTIESLDDLASVPLMVKDDLNVALEHLEPRAQNATTWTFQSGGSTGAPKFGYAPSGLYMEEVYEHYKPLDRDDIFVNGWSAGKMWGSHYLHNALVDRTGCRAMSLGTIGRDEYDFWLEFFRVREVTAFGGTTSVLRLIFGHAAATGVTLPALRKVLWLGEAWDKQLDEDIPAVAPDAGRYGLYGSTETWVVGYNLPSCPDDVWHPLPSQLIAVGASDMLDFTSLKPDGLNPVLRYQTGDAGGFVSCRCGRPGRALQVLGRRDGVVKFRGFLLNADDIVDKLASKPGVSRAQVLVTEYSAQGSSIDVLVMPSRDAPPDLTEQVRRQLLGSEFGLSTVFDTDPEAFQVRLVEEPLSNPRTGKTTNLVMQRGS